MRILVVLLLGVVVSRSIVSADDVVLVDGRVLRGSVTSITIEGREPLPRSELAAVRLTHDRAALDAAWIEHLLRFSLDRARRGVKENGKIGVYVGRGVSAPSAIAVVRRLDKRKRAPRLLFEADISRRTLAGLRTLVVPGGWAPSQLTSLGASGQDALKAFVTGGGHYLGICAGGYLPCEDVVWKGTPHAYPVRLVAGSASGPVVGQPPWPQSGTLDLVVAGEGAARALYAGGCWFTVPRAEVLASYPDGSAAAILVEHGKGRLLLTGAHVEFDEREDADLLGLGGWAEGLKPGNAALFDRFLQVLRKPR